MTSILEDIDNGKYTSTIPYSKEGREDKKRLLALLRKDLAEHCGIPQGRSENLIYEMAYEHDCFNGLREVACTYLDLADLYAVIKKEIGS